MKYDIDSIEKRKRTTKFIKNVLYIIFVIIIYNVVLLGLSSMNKLQNINIFGYKSYIITTQSMEPAISAGDIVISKITKEQDLQEGDVITFETASQEIITHRIVKIEDSQNVKYYITKGDNNTQEDNEQITFDKIEGKAVLVIPTLGKIIKALENKIILLFALLIVLVLCFWKIQRDEKRDNRREKKKIEDEKKRKD